MGLNRDFWRGRRVLLTGHTGFKGAWLSLWLEHLGAQVTGIALAPDGSDCAYAAFAPLTGHRSILHDIRDADGLAEHIRAAKPQVVLHMAAQALVRASYDDPLGTYATNVQGTANVLKALEGCEGVQAVVAVTSDKVYANNDEGRPFVEGDRLGGADPYSNSKACCELLVECWRRSFYSARGIPVATGRAGNVIGGGDTARDRLLPDLYRALDAGQSLKLRNPDSTRPWQFVLEPVAGYLLLAEALANGSAPPAVNFGPGPDGAWSVRRVIDHTLAHLGEGRWEQDGVPGPHEAKFLSLDAGLATRALGWRPCLSVGEALAWTADWWRTGRSGGDLRALALHQIQTYSDLMDAGAAR